MTITTMIPGPARLLTLVALTWTLAGCGAGNEASNAGGGSGTVSLVPNSSLHAITPRVGQNVDDEMIMTTVSNTSLAQINVTVTSSANWLGIVSFNGLAMNPGEPRVCEARIVGSIAQQLPAGNYQATLDFHSASNQIGSLQVDLTMGAATEQGWTVFTPSSDSRVIYVSAAGSDSNNGLTEQAPKRTIAGGRSQIRDNSADWLLFRRGDTFQGRFDPWTANGRSPAERVLIGAYGTGPRPIIDVPVNGSGLGNGGANVMRNLVFTSLDFTCSTYTGGANVQGMLLYGTVHDMLIEDCRFSNFATAFTIVGPTTTGSNNVTMRRNQLVACWNTANSHSHGIYAERVNNLLLEENLLDHNGWNSLVAGAVRTQFQHQAYLQFGSGPSIVRNNMVSRSGGAGVQMRSGGTCIGNVFADNSVSLRLIGNEPFADLIEDNVFTLATSTNASSPNHVGVGIEDPVNVTARRNLFMQGNFSVNPPAVIVGGGSLNVVNNVLLTQNVIHAYGYVDFRVPTSWTGVSMTDNQLQEPTVGRFVVALGSNVPLSSANNRYYANAPVNNWTALAGVPRSLSYWMSALNDTTSSAQTINYPDANRSLMAYWRSLGNATGDHNDLLDAMRNQRKGNWRPEYTVPVIAAYLREGFGL